MNCFKFVWFLMCGFPLQKYVSFSPKGNSIVTLLQTYFAMYQWKTKHTQSLYCNVAFAFIYLFQGIGKLSLVAASAANVVQAGTKEITSKVFGSILDGMIAVNIYKKYISITKTLYLFSWNGVSLGVWRYSYSTMHHFDMLLLLPEFALVYLYS